MTLKTPSLGPGFYPRHQERIRSQDKLGTHQDKTQRETDKAVTGLDKPGIVKDKVTSFYQPTCVYKRRIGSLNVLYRFSTSTDYVFQVSDRRRQNNVSDNPCPLFKCAQ